MNITGLNITKLLLPPFSLLCLAWAAVAFPDAPVAQATAGAKPAQTASGTRSSQTFSSLDFPVPNEDLMPPGTVALAEADLPAAFALYERISGRSVIPGDRMPHPKLTYRIEKAMPRRELLQALDTLLAQYGVTMVVMGTNFAKAVIEAEASREAAPEVSLPAELLPDSNTYIQYVVRLEHRPVNSVIPVLQPFARLPNSLLTLPASNSIIVRDYAANVRRMLSAIRRFDVPDDGRVFDEPARRPRR